MSDSQTDVIVVGAGIIGLMTAWALHRAGKSVIVLDKGEVGREASWAGGGILSQLGPWRYPDDLQALAAESQAMYPALCAQLHELSGIDPEFRQSGLLCLPDEAEYAQAVAWAGEHSARYELLSVDDVQARYPQLDVAQPGLLLPAVAQIRNPRLLQALTKTLLNAGVEIRGRQPVRRLDIDHARVLGVHTTQGRLQADQVLLACGAWTPELIPRQYQRPDIQPIKGQMLLYQALPGLLDQIVLKGDRYLIPRKDGQILAGSSMEEDGFNKSPTIDVKQELRSFAESLLPELAQCEISAHWTGLRPASPDGRPTIGRHPELEGLWINAGHFRYGLTMAPATARALSEAMTATV